MKKITAIFVMAFAILSAAAALPQPDLIARIYFAGAAKISSAPNVSAFTNEFCSPEALALRKQTADKLAPWLAGWLQTHLGTSVPDGAAWLRPLLDDLQSSEWLAESRAMAGGPPEVALAIRLDAQRMAAWQAGLKPFFPAAKFSVTGGWLIFDSGTGGSKLGAALAQEISVPQKSWFSLDVNWPHLAQWFPELGKLELPETQFTVIPLEHNFLINGKFFFLQPPALNLEPWQFPTNLVNQPFVSLTAVRGFASWLRTQDWLQPYQVTPAPNQVFIWAMQGIPYQTYLAEPVPDAAGALDQTYQRLQPLFSPTGRFNQGIHSYSIQKTNNEISMVDMPMFAPFIQAVKGPSGQYLFAGGFPIPGQNNPLPPQMSQQLAIPKLVLYHWESTSARVPDILQFSQLALWFTDHVELDGNSAAFKWLEHLAPTLGDTVTEITVAAPDQMVFKRSAPGVFTSAELFVLANWLEARNFPGCDLREPTLTGHRKHPHPQVPR